MTADRRTPHQYSVDPFCAILRQPADEERGRSFHGTQFKSLPAVELDEVPVRNAVALLSIQCSDERLKESCPHSLVSRIWRHMHPPQHHSLELSRAAHETEQSPFCLGNKHDVAARDATAVTPLRVRGADSLDFLR